MKHTRVGINCLREVPSSGPLGIGGTDIYINSP